MTVSGSFEDFMEQFKKRHANDYAGERQATTQTVAHSPSYSPTKLVNAPQNAESVRLAVVLEDEWEPPEFAEIDEPEEWWNK